MENDDMDLTGYVVNYKEVSNNNDMLAVTRMLATRMQKSPYITVKDFLSTLSDGDLEQLLEIAEEEDYEQSTHYSELLLITEMLSRGEGLITRDVEHMTQNLNSFVAFLAIEGLARKGLVEVYRENMSFGEDMAKKIIVRVRKISD